MAKESKSYKYEILPYSTILLLLLSYFVYNKDINMVLGMLLLSIVSGFSIIISVIPGVGFLALYYVNLNYLYPNIFQFTGLYETWVTTILFWAQIVTGAIISTIMLYQIIKK